VTRRHRLAISLASIAALAGSLACAWLLHRPAPPRMMHVGGATNPCTCTQRIEP
jgi:hypothetical protein